MWIILGNKVKTQRVAGGRKLERQCPSCGEVAMFYEREVTTSFRVYFVSIFNYETQRVMACGACGDHYATDELGRPPAGEPPGDQKGTVYGSVKDALRKAGNALQDATGVQADADVTEEATAPPPAEQRRLAAPPPQTTAPPAREPEDAFIDPLAADDDDLNARFAALEKKLARERSAQKPLKKP